jgi:hypothetical protein
LVLLFPIRHDQALHEVLLVPNSGKKNELWRPQVASFNFLTQYPMKKFLLTAGMAVLFIIGLTSMVNSSSTDPYPNCQEDCALLVSIGFFSTQGTPAPNPGRALRMRFASAN